MPILDSTPCHAVSAWCKRDPLPAPSCFAPYGSGRKQLVGTIVPMNRKFLSHHSYSHLGAMLTFPPIDIQRLGNNPFRDFRLNLLLKALPRRLTSSSLPKFEQMRAATREDFMIAYGLISQREYNTWKFQRHQDMVRAACMRFAFKIQST